MCGGLGERGQAEVIPANRSHVSESKDQKSDYPDLYWMLSSQMVKSHYFMSPLGKRLSLSKMFTIKYGTNLLGIFVNILIHELIIIKAEHKTNVKKC